MNERNVRRFRRIETAHNRAQDLLSGQLGLVLDPVQDAWSPQAAVVAFELLKILKAGNPGHKLGPVISSTLVECLSLTAASIIVNEFRIR
jgi:hypothetical protein